MDAPAEVSRRWSRHLDRVGLEFSQRASRKNTMPNRRDSECRAMLNFVLAGEVGSSSTRRAVGRKTSSRNFELYADTHLIEHSVKHPKIHVLQGEGRNLKDQRDKSTSIR